MLRSARPADSQDYHQAGWCVMATKKKTASEKRTERLAAEWKKQWRAEYRAKIKKEQTERINATTREQRIEFVRALRQGQTVGAAAKLTGFDIDTALIVWRRSTKTIKITRLIELDEVK